MVGIWNFSVGVCLIREMYCVVVVKFGGCVDNIVGRFLYFIIFCVLGILVEMLYFFRKLF